MLVDLVTRMVLVQTAVRLTAAPGPADVELAPLWYATLVEYGPQ